MTKFNMLLNFLIKFILLIILLSIYVPFSPKMPAQGLDPSWELGLNQAVAQGLAFGKDIIFTLGPYSFIYTKSYHPATDLMMMSGTIYLAISYWIALLLLMKNLRWYSILPLCIVFLGMIYARDSLMFFYPLLVGIITYKLNLSENPLIHSRSISTALIFAPLGLLSLVKGSLLILCVMMTVFCVSFFLANNRKTLAIICLATTISSTILFWLGANQSLIYLPNYLISSISIASDFTEAMSVKENIIELICYLIPCLLIFSFIIWQKSVSKIEKLFLLTIYFVFLFISFKTGFTRHFGHGFIPGTSILLAAISLFFIFDSLFVYILLIISLASWNFINNHYTKISLLNNFVSIYSTSWHGIKNRILNPCWLEENFTLILNFLAMQASFPKMQGTTDIYSYNQSYLISSQNKWSPRPIFQSYSVFSPNLAEKNKAHLQGSSSPDNIIFKIEPIDNRVPSIEDGASWPLLLTHYQPTHIQNGFLFLQKNASKRRTKVYTSSELHVLGELVDVPAHKQTLFATIEIKPTLLGELAIFFYKPGQLQMTFILQDGTKKQHRLIGKMGKSPFLLSPLIENTDEFSKLYKNNYVLNEKKVKSFVITTDQSEIWDKVYLIKYRQTEI